MVLIFEPKGENDDVPGTLLPPLGSTPYPLSSIRILTECAVPCIPYQVPCILYLVSCILYQVSCILYPVSCTLVSCILYTVPGILYTVYCTRYAASCILYPVSCFLYPVAGILYHVSCTRYPVSCVLLPVYCVLSVPCYSVPGILYIRTLYCTAIRARETSIFCRRCPARMIYLRCFPFKTVQ